MSDGEFMKTEGEQNTEPSRGKMAGQLGLGHCVFATTRVEVAHHGYDSNRKAQETSERYFDRLVIHTTPRRGDSHLLPASLSYSSMQRAFFCKEDGLLVVGPSGR